MKPMKLLRFYTLVGKHFLLRKACNVVVAAHVRTTPQSSTEDTVNTIIQEQLRTAVRRLEQKAHTVKTQYEDIGKEILHG